MGDNSSDDPFAPRDGTIIRPRPGAGRRSPTDGPPPAAGSTPPPSRSPSVAAQNFAGGGATVSLDEFVGTGGNPLLQAAAPLLMLASRLQSVVQQANLATLRQ